jgi:hypothetical protein
VADKKLPPELTRLLSTFQGPTAPSAIEGLQLMRAFMDIKNSSLRASIVELVEKIAAARITKP